MGGRLRDDAGRKRECKKSAQFAAADSLRAKHIREEPNLSAHFHANKTVFALQCRENFTTPFWIARHTATPPLSLVSQSPPDDDELLSLARRPGSGEKALPSAMQQDGRFLETLRVSTGAATA